MRNLTAAVIQSDITVLNASDDSHTSEGRVSLQPSVEQRRFRVKVHLREHHQQPGFPIYMSWWISTRSALVQGYLAHKEAHACARKCIDSRELLAARSFAFHTAIMPGTAPGPGAPPRGFRTRCEALALLNRDASL